jgi:hypothetical protein
MSTPPEPDSRRVLKIVALIVLSLVALCGVVGTCLFVVTLLVPAFSQ